jgi:hypothetical protein
LGAIVLEQIGDQHDEPNFERDWMNIYDFFKEQKKTMSLPKSIEKQITKIGELAFQKSYSITGNPDIAACVSDDFDLIATQSCIGNKHKLIGLLHAQYKL